MLMKVVGSVPGYAELLESAKQQASTLAAIPPGAAPSGHRRARARAADLCCVFTLSAEVYHWEGVEAFQDREAHATVKRALLDAEPSSAQCVVAHGMGGTGTQAGAPPSLPPFTHR